MKDQIDTFVYMMANEKTVNMIQTVENTLEFMDEYGVKPDDEVKKAMMPIVERLKEWINDTK